MYTCINTTSCGETIPVFQSLAQYYIILLRDIMKSYFSLSYFIWKDFFALKPQRARHYFKALCNNKEIVKRKAKVSGKLEALLT